MNIRILGYKDAKQYKKLRLQALTDHPAAFSSSYVQEKNYTIQEIEDRLRPQADLFTLGAFKDDQLIGIVTFKRETSAKLNHKGHVLGMYVVPEAREQGVASFLMEELFRLLRKNKGLEHLLLAVESTNASAIAFYESLGFKQFALEQRALKIDGAYYDEIWLAKIL